MSVERAIVSRRGSSRLVYTRRLLPDPAFHSVRTLSLSFPCAVCLVLATGKGPCWRWSSLWWILDALVHSGAGATNREAGERIRERVVLNADGQSAANPPIRDDGPANSLALVYAAQELFGCVWNKENWYWRERREKNHALGYDSRAMSNDAPGCESLAWWFPSLSLSTMVDIIWASRRIPEHADDVPNPLYTVRPPSLSSVHILQFHLFSFATDVDSLRSYTDHLLLLKENVLPSHRRDVYLHIPCVLLLLDLCVAIEWHSPPGGHPLVISVVHLSLQFSLSLSPIYDAAMTRDGIGHPAHDVPLIPISALRPGRKECPSTQWHPSDMQHRSTDWINQRHRDDLPLFIRVFKNSWLMASDRRWENVNWWRSCWRCAPCSTTDLLPW